MAEIRPRRLGAGDADALIRFIAAHNQPGPQHCLHLAGTEAGVRADFDKSRIDVAAGFAVVDAAGPAAGSDADAPATWRGAAGVECDAEQCWLHGPWAASTDPQAAGAEGKADAGAPSVRRAVLAAALQQAGVRRVHAFCDQRAEPVIAELEAAGFRRHREVHVMRAGRGARGRAERAVRADVSIGDAGRDDVAAIAALHDIAFPGTWIDGAGMVEQAQRLGRMLVAHGPDGVLQGSLCLTFNTELPEGDVEFVAVQPAARGAGVGRALLQAALRAAFDDAARTAVNLCVNDANLNALHLYESCGFERIYTGIALTRPAPV